MLQPLRVANTVVLVSRPTTEGVRACGHVMKLLTEVVGAQHRFARDAFFLVLNQRTPKSIYTAPAFSTELAKYAGWSPPVLAVVDYDPDIPRAQDDGRPAVSASDSLGRAAATLVETFYGTAHGAESLRKHLQDRADQDPADGVAHMVMDLLDPTVSRQTVWTATPANPSWTRSSTR